MCPTCSRVLCPVVLHVSHAFGSLVSYVPCPLRALVPHVPFALRAIDLTCLVLYVTSNLTCLVPYVLSCLTCLVPYVLSCFTCPSCLLLCVLHVSISPFLLLFSHTSRDFFLFISNSLAFLKVYDSLNE